MTVWLFTTYFLEYNDALRLALCAGQYLDISTKSEYVDTIIAKCIDEYKTQRTLQESDSTVRSEKNVLKFYDLFFISVDNRCRLIDWFF